MSIESIVARQREYFRSGATLPVNRRQEALKSLRSSILKYKEQLFEALKSDLGKSEAEAYMCEVGLTLSELTYVLKHTAKWCRNSRVKTPLTNFHAKSFVVKQPYGVVLIMSPWNYPVLLALEPLVGAISAGNCCVIKPSAYSPATSRVLGDIIKDAFVPEFVTLIEGGRMENQTLLDQKFDYIFFTGGVNVGKEVMSKAAKNLTPVTLELGGKSPCIVEKSADIKVAARRIVFGKYLNCGQTCVAPDYLLVDQEVKEALLAAVKKEIKAMFGASPLDNRNYGKIINEKHYNRILSLIDNSKVYCGGRSDARTLQIEPTVLVDVTEDDAVMQEEIFGPVLPVITFEDINEAFNFVQNRPSPLALYIFTNNKNVEELFLKRVSFGGGCVNDTIIHLATSEMGFGGVGNSGMGSYHGKKSFDTFTHQKSIVKKYNWLDLTMRYQPYNSFKTALIKLFLR